jgi:hypothetical protein
LEWNNNKFEPLAKDVNELKIRVTNLETRFDNLIIVNNLRE